MTGLEAAAIALTSVVVKSAAKIWLGDRQIAADAAASAVDLLQKQASSALDKRKLASLFRNLEDRVTDRLLPYLEVEFRSLPENERLAAIEAVRATFERAALTDEDLFAIDLDPGFLHRYLVRTVRDDFLLSADATALYHRVLRECCAYLVQVTTTLPRFQPGALTEVLRRETEILDTVRKVLAALPERRHQDDFAADYRRQVVTALDRMSLFGAGLSSATRLYPLSVAYLSLTVTTDKIGDLVEEAPEIASADRIEHVLPHSTRILLRGEAGSGKTTLLQWLAVRCASRGLRNIKGWGDLEPFLIRLRRYGSAPLPDPGHFLEDVGRHIADEMPSGWVQRKLREGRAVLLIDGLDELPDDRREEVRVWLQELSYAFPYARYVVTTRPAAVTTGWLGDLGFIEVRLQPMTPRDVQMFVQRWHAAMPATDEAERRELGDHCDALTAAVARRATLRRLAENPLLCALLCALHRERNGHLPSNRMELYDVALTMLLDRRDAERKIVPALALSLTEKRVLLRHLAYWLVRNGHTDIPAEVAAERIAAKLETMGQVAATPQAVLRHLLNRGGVLREPVPGRIDFLHRTFQEYLAAEAVIEDDDIGLLLDHSGRDDWREVVVMAAGRARPPQRERLLTGLLNLGTDTAGGAYFDMVALACLETSPELSQDLRARILDRAETLLPPPDTVPVSDLVAAGEFVLDLLIDRPPKTVASTQAVIRTIGQIGGPNAIPALAEFGARRENVIVSEIMAAWTRFDPVEFAKNVLANSPLVGGAITIRDPAVIPGLRYLNELEALHCIFDKGYGRLDFVRDLPRLRELSVEDPAGYDVPALAGSALTRIALAGDTGISVDLGPLAHIRGLRSVSSSVPSHHWTALAGLPDLTELTLDQVWDVERLAELARVTDLVYLQLGQVTNLVSLDALGFLRAPDTLVLDGCPMLRDISAVRRWSESLRAVVLSRCHWADPAPLADLSELTMLDLRFIELRDLRPLSTLGELQDLYLIGLPEPPDLAPIADLPHLSLLSLNDSGVVDLTPLAGRAGLMVHAAYGQQLKGVELLGPGSTVMRSSPPRSA